MAAALVMIVGVAAGVPAQARQLSLSGPPRGAHKGPTVASLFMAIDGQYNMYVLGQASGDPSHWSLLKVSPAGKVLARWGALLQPADLGGIAIASDGTLFVGDTEENQVVHLDASLKLLGRWGSMGSGRGQFANDAIEGVALDSQGNVYVADCGNSRIQVFSSTGRLVRTLIGQSKSQPFDCVVGLAIDSADTLYAVDHRNMRLIEFAHGRAWRKTISLQYQSLTPEGVAVLPGGTAAYVAFPKGNVIVKYSLPSGRVIARWNLGRWSTFAPALGPAGEVYGVESNFQKQPPAGRLVRFSRSGRVAARWS
jgi:sugar lactone lactonase YvrE